MTYLEKLLDGAPVAWKPLGEVCGFRNGFAFRHNTFQGKGLPIIRISDIQEGKVLLDKTVFFDLSDYKEDLAPYELKRGDVVISLSGIIKTALVDFESSAYLNQRVGKFLPKQELLNHKFLYYYLERKNKELQKMAVGQLPPNLSSVRLMKEFLIPLPPLPVQEHIVGILDKYTALEAELEKELAAELEARKRQYRYYRNKLLQFGEEVEWRSLEEVFEIRTGYTPSKANKKEYWNNGTIPWFRMEDLRAQGGVLTDSIQHITPQAVKGKGLFKAGSIILSTTATIGEHALLLVDALTNQRFTNFNLRTEIADRVLSKFLYYYFFEIAAWCKNHVFIGTFPSVDMRNLRLQKFPIPPLAVQQQIVEVLSKYDTFVHSLSEGLPAEVKMRRKQYEHYRRLLLDFPKPRQ